LRKSNYFIRYIDLHTMKKTSSIILFKQKQIRRHWDEEKELWYFSIIDVIEILTDSTIPKRYWSDLKIKLQKEGSEVYEKIVHLKFVATEGKKYATDCFSTEDLLRVIQSIPSPSDKKHDKNNDTFLIAE